MFLGCMLYSGLRLGFAVAILYAGIVNYLPFLKGYLKKLTVSIPATNVYIPDIANGILTK